MAPLWFICVENIRILLLCYFLSFRFSTHPRFSPGWLRNRNLLSFYSWFEDREDSLIVSFVTTFSFLHSLICQFGFLCPWATIQLGRDISVNYRWWAANTMVNGWRRLSMDHCLAHRHCSRGFK